MFFESVPIRKEEPLMKTHSLQLTTIGSLLALGAALLAPAVVASAETPSAEPRPVIEVQEMHQDAGLFEEGSVVPFRFLVANRGQADLELTRVKPNCGCTDVKYDHLIKPGEQGTIQAELHTDYFGTAVTKHVAVFSNDPAQPLLDLTITAHLVPLVKVSPSPAAQLSMGDQAVSREFTLERNGGRPMKIVQVVPYATFIKAATTPLPGQGRYKLTLTATPDAPMGRTTVPVDVWTDVDKGGIVNIIVHVDRGIVTIPPMAFFGVVPRAMTTPRQSMVTLQRDSTPFHIKKVVVDDPKLSPKVEAVRAGAEYRVTVTYTGGWDTTGLRRQMLTVTTDDPKQPVIEIPVQAAIQAKVAAVPRR
jgi:hypothetical protein